MLFCLTKLGFPRGQMPQATVLARDLQARARAYATLLIHFSNMAARADHHLLPCWVAIWHWFKAFTASHTFGASAHHRLRKIGKLHKAAHSGPSAFGTCFGKVT